jgi:hypothetical protein
MGMNRHMIVSTRLGELTLVAVPGHRSGWTIMPTTGGAWRVSIAMIQDRSRLSGSLTRQPEKTSLIALELLVRVLESGLGATPHEFESRILRHSLGVKKPQVRARFRFSGRTRSRGGSQSGSRPGDVPSQVFRHGGLRPQAGVRLDVVQTGPACCRGA